MCENENNEVEERILVLLNENLNVPLSYLEPSNWDEPLTGAVFNLNGIDLVYLLFEIEKHYQIRINEELLQNNSFNSISEIAKAIKLSKGSITINHKNN